MIGLLISIALLGLLVWVLITYVPMPAAFRSAIIVIAVLLLVLYLIGALGVVDLPIPRVR
jgi:hypothetical protein